MRENKFVRKFVEILEKWENIFHYEENFDENSFYDSLQSLLSNDNEWVRIVEIEIVQSQRLWKKNQKKKKSIKCTKIYFNEQNKWCQNIMLTVKICYRFHRKIEWEYSEK